MRVRLRQLFDEQGQCLPRWRFGGLPWHVGNLEIRDKFAADLSRHSICASLIDSTSNLIIPVLYDVSRVQIIGNEIQVSGFVFESTFRRITAQTWFIELVDASTQLIAAQGAESGKALLPDA
jgi:hypothetical protein